MNLAPTYFVLAVFFFFCWCQLTQPGAFSKPKTRRKKSHRKPRPVTTYRTCCGKPLTECPPGRPHE